MKTHKIGWLEQLDTIIVENISNQTIYIRNKNSTDDNLGIRIFSAGKIKLSGKLMDYIITDSLGDTVVYE